MSPGPADRPGSPGSKRNQCQPTGLPTKLLPGATTNMGDHLTNGRTTPGGKTPSSTRKDSGSGHLEASSPEMLAPKVQFKIGRPMEAVQNQNLNTQTSLKMDEENNNISRSGSKLSSILSSQSASPTQNKQIYRNTSNSDRVPNSSFLWTKAQKLSSHEHGPEEKKSQIHREVGEGSVLDDGEFYDDVGITNYQLIEDYKNNPMNHSYMDITSARYLNIGSRKSVASTLGSYDDIRAPNLLAPSCSRVYLSADNLSLVQYDDVKASQREENSDDDEDEELHNSALVTATPCVVLEVTQCLLLLLTVPLAGAKRQSELRV